MRTLVRRAPRFRPWLILALTFALLLVGAVVAPPVSATTVLWARPVPTGRAEPAPSSATASTALEGTAEAQPRRGEAAPAPGPNAAAPPGMCPGVLVQGGGSASASSSGDGTEGNPGDAAATEGGEGENAEGGTAGTGEGGENKDCGTASHPVDVGTGRAFTHPIVDFELAGPLPLRFASSASSQAAGIDTGMGPSWSHTLGWQIEERRRYLRLWSDKGVYADFPKLDVGQKVIGPWGWVLEREAWGYQLDRDDGVWRMFSVKRPDSDVWLLTAIEDRNKNRIELVYADDGARLHSVTDSAGRLLKVKTDPVGHILSFQVLNAVAQGQWVTLAEYTYDDRHNLVRARDADGFVAKYASDGRHFHHPE